MDPLSSLSIAGKVIQFVDFGSRFLSRAGELYKSATGTLAVNDELELVTNDLRALILKIRESASTNTQGAGAEELNDPWNSFRKTCNEAASVADEIIERLSKLKVQGGKRRKL
jgi:hypothetical protein